MITRADLVFGREMGPSRRSSRTTSRRPGAQAAQRAAAQLAGRRAAAAERARRSSTRRCSRPGLGFKQAKQTVVDAFEIAYLGALMVRNDGNITRSAQEAGLTRYHLRELLKRHGLKGGDTE